MPKCIVSGYIGFDNFGDEAIASVLSKKLKQDGYEVTLISSNPNKTAHLYDVKSCGMFGFLIPLIKADRLVSGGGSLLQDVTSIKSLIYYLSIIYLALFMRKKVEIFAQGIGPIESKFGQVLTKFALSKAEKISVRDEQSQNLLKDWGINATLVKDPVFDMEININQQKRNAVGVQLRKFKGVTDEFLQNLAKEVKTKYAGKEIEVLSLQDSIDLDVCEKFAKLTGGKVYSGMTVEETIRRISSLECLIAMRFHANVIGIKAGVKTIAINYDPKVKKLADEYNLEIIELGQENILL